MMTFESKKIAVCVTGGIAAYKTCELVRTLRRLGAEVRVAMTRAAQEFVSELTFATLSENAVLTSLFTENAKLGVVHIDLAHWCDSLVVCPATANVIGKAAHGLADDAVSTTILATKSKVLFCPAMNTSMWENAVVQGNVKALREFGYEIMSPDWGRLATTAEGEGYGRLPEVERIVAKLEQLLLGSYELRGKKVLVTAGPTKEPLDPVRFLSNLSSGKMGFALAQSAALMGAKVVLVTGAEPSGLFDQIQVIKISSTEEMQRAVEEEYADSDFLVMAAAVADYRPKRVSRHKLKKAAKTLSFVLEPTADILAALGAQKSDCIHVGFALETENGVANATRKLHAKNLDVVVLNNPLEAGAGFAVDTNIATIITRDGEIEKLPLLEKSVLSKVVLNKALRIFEGQNQRQAAV
ncbi:bifunctional phosphopantothenoylcysteine decarboxylase/phosphopantothenate--cysteine ligase CoaBC [bacterium]|nr:bifunctional phosphopantothenoylcysteine decarboxylase/phosphopantothenate--cysteine ligase CoaBC [bacterium]